MKPEPSEAKTKQSIKTGFNFTSQRFSNKWKKKLIVKDRNVTHSKSKTVFFGTVTINLILNIFLD